MTTPQQRFYKEQYEGFKREMLCPWGVDAGDLASLEARLKPIHKRYLALGCAATVVGHRAKRNEYAEAIIEAGYLTLVLSVKGLENSSCVLLRQCIELVLKHIYFAWHPVEHQWASSREDYRDLTFQYLLDYLRRTDEYKSLSPRDQIGERLNFWFGALSRYVHVHSKRFVQYKEVGKSFGPRRDVVERTAQRTKQLWPLLVVLLVGYFPDKYFRASALEQTLIKSVLPKDLRDVLNGYLRSLQ